MECGDCTVCCTLSVVKELKKKAGELCFNCVDNGCKVYGNHPQVCKDFECAYLQAGNDIELRPDKCGIMFVKKNERIFTGMLVPGMEISSTGIGQIVSFKEQGYSVVMLKIGEKPHIELAEGHNSHLHEKEIYKEYINLLMNGNV